MAKVYYNQMDKRWASYPYPHENHPYATCKSAGCGPTCAAMVVSSSKEVVTPDVMCQISLDNGYRSSNGTSDGLFSYVAERWGLETKRVNSSYEAHEACKQGYFVVIACGQGLWTTGGHYILAVGANDNEIEIYDPYLYDGKFDIDGRKGKVRLDGVSAWVEINTFKANSNAQRFFAFKINEEEIVPDPVVPTEKEAWVNTQSKPLNVRKTPGGEIIGSLEKGTKVIIKEQNGNWSLVNQGWVSTSYLTYVEPNSNKIAWINTNSKPLNIRKTPNGEIVGSVAKNTKVTVYAIENGWAKIGENSWVSNQYLRYEENKEPEVPVVYYVKGRYQVTANKGLNVRYSPNGQIKKAYANGTVFDTYEIQKNWARTPSGWVCLDFCKLLYRY